MGAQYIHLYTCTECVLTQYKFCTSEPPVHFTTHAHNMQGRTESSPNLLHGSLYSGQLGTKHNVLIREVPIFQRYVVLYTSVCSRDSRHCPQ